jgi:UDP-N-acetylglucosamine kinase
MSEGEMTEQEKELCKDAETFVKKNGDLIKKKFADESFFPADEHPVSIFMAGSPGAGKTEVSKRLIQQFKTPVVRIDADEIRIMFKGYTGDNSFVFQSACTMAVNNLLGHCLKRKFNLILDATFAYRGSLENISASLAKGRRVEVYFIFQEPIKAWYLTKEREKIEHRRVTKEIFINSFLGAI